MYIYTPAHTRYAHSTRNGHGNATNYLKKRTGHDGICPEPPGCRAVVGARLVKLSVK